MWRGPGIGHSATVSQSIPRTPADGYPSLPQIFLPHLKGKKVSVDLAEAGYAEAHSLVALDIGGHCTLQKR